MNLSNLRTSFIDMTYEAALNLIMSIRLSRRTSKKASVAKKTSTGTRKVNKDIDLDTLLMGMTKEQRLKILGGL